MMQEISLVNTSLKVRKGVIKKMKSKRSKQKAKQHKNRTDTLVETFAVKIEDDDSSWIGVVQKRTTAMWFRDSILLCLDHLQLFSLILSLSLAWPWPIGWIKGTSFVFLFNLDLWEFTKVHTVYQGRNHAFEDPNSIPFDYFWYSLILLLLVVLCPVIFTALYALIPRVTFTSPVSILLLRAKLVRAFLLLAHIFAIPFGLTVARLFDCQDYTTRDTGQTRFRSVVLRDTDCWNMTHLGLLILLVTLAIPYFIILPAWMIYRIRKELIVPLICTYRTWRTHENHLLLKEAEYTQGLDIEWATHHYPLFSSFRRPWVWFQPLTFIMKMLILFIYGGLFYSPVCQASALFGVVAVVCLVVLLLPVYRIRLFNFFLTYSVFINLCNVTVGLLLTLEVQNALLFGQNLLNILLAINVSWCLVFILFVCFLIARRLKPIRRMFGPLWPVLSELDQRSKWRSDHTEKFFRAILRGRKILERCYSLPTFFAPIHELSSHIQIISAYFREAEVLEDPSLSTLWALLAEMIDTHTELAPLSVYGTSTKDSVPHTVQQLMEVMPAFKKRLDEREYDFILWTPLKRRILLKLFVVATFLRIHKERTVGNVAEEQSSVRNHRASTLSFLNDSSELKNDAFLQDIEKWENDRKKSIWAASGGTDGPFPRESRIVSIGSLQTEDEEHFHEVELWESQGRKHTSNTTSYNRPNSAGSVDERRHSNMDYAQNRVRSAGSVDSISSRGSEVATPGILTNKKSNRPHSKLSVHFNLLDTISEHDSSRNISPVSFTSMDNFIESIDQQFPQV